MKSLFLDIVEALPDNTIYWVSLAMKPLYTGIQ